MKKYGLDFGTTNTSIAIRKDGVGQVLLLDSLAIDPRVIRTMIYFLRRELHISQSVPEKRLNSQTFTKSEITYSGDQIYSIGQSAVLKYMQDNKFRKPGIIRNILTGKMVSAGPGAEPVPEFYQDIDFGTGRFIHAIKTALKSLHYKGTSIFGEFYSLEDLIAAFVGDIKKLADQAEKADITQLVVGRPVHFSDDPIKDKAAQDRLEKALRQVGMSQIKFVFEPIAAAEQFIATSGQNNQRVFVFDFGGGTLDTAIVESGENSKVLAADGIYIGGDMLNADIVRQKLWGYFGFNAKWSDQELPMPSHIYESLSSWFSIPNLNNPQNMQMFERLRYKNSNPEALKRLVYLIEANLGFDLYEAVEKAKKELSNFETAQITFQNGPIDINLEITKSEFEEIIAPRVAEIKKIIFKTLIEANLKPEQIDVVVRTGGSSLIPVFENLLVNIFGKDKIKQFETFTSIAAGLSLID